MKTKYKFFKGPYCYDYICFDPCPTREQEIEFRENYNPGTLIVFTDKEVDDAEKLSLEDYTKEYGELEDKLKKLNIYRISEVHKYNIPDVLKKRGL